MKDRRAELERIIARAERSLARTRNFSMNCIDRAIIRSARAELAELDATEPK